MRFHVTLGLEDGAERRHLVVAGETYEEGYTAAEAACPDGWVIERVSTETSRPGD